MALSSDILSAFAKITVEADKPNTAGTVVNGTAKAYAGGMYVQLDGSDQLTPITSSTAGMKDGDRVTVLVKDHKTTVTGNVSSPSVTTDEFTDTKEEIGSKIEEFENVIADTVTTGQLEAESARIDDLVTETLAVKDRLTATEADITDLTANKASITELEAAKAEIDQLEANMLTAEAADIKYATIANLEATNANIHNLQADYGEFEELATGKFTAIEADILELDTGKLSAEEADLKYANIDFSNIGVAAVEELFAKSGIIGDLVVSEGHITGHLVGVTISGDLIQGNTIKADKLVVLGDDGLYYKLNVSGESVAAEQTQYNSLNGSIITANTITAEKINVDDLVAFNATIGGFHIDDHALYSGAKASVDNTTRGTYMDDDGQFVIGDNNNYLKFFLDETDSKWKLQLSAESIKIGASGTSLEEKLEQIEANNGKLTETVSGNSILTAEDSGGRKPYDLKVYGQTKQNLWVNPSGTVTKNGITVTPNSDGSVSVNGTSTSSTLINLYASYALTPGTQYTISVDKLFPMNGSEKSGGFYVQRAIEGQESSTIAYLMSTGSSKESFTVPEETEHCIFGLQVIEGATVSGTYRVMLNEGSEAEPWCPPGLHSVGELMPHERNLWQNPSGTSNGLTVTANEDGSITLSGTPTLSNQVNISTYALKPGSTYTVSKDVETTGVKFLIQSYDSGRSFLRNEVDASGWGNVKTFTLHDDAAYVVFGISAAVGQAASGTYRVMLNEGSTAFPWVPPGCESLVTLVTAGKNLIDTSGAREALGITPVVNADGSVTINGTPLRSGGILMCADFSVKAGTYVLSGIKKGNPYGTTRFELYNRSSDSPNNAIVSVGGSNSDTASFALQEDSTLRLALIVFSSQTYNNFTVYPQLELGSTATEYEPPNINTVPIDLQGNELCSLPDGTRDVLDVGNGLMMKEVVKTSLSDAVVSVYVQETSSHIPYVILNNVIAPFGNSADLVTQNVMCDTWPSRVSVAERSIYRTWNALVIADERFTNKEVAQQIINDTGGYVVANIPPTEIQLTPPDFPALPEGTAHAWLSVNDPMDPDFDLTYWTEYGKVVSEVKDEADRGITAAQDSASNASETAQDAMNELNSVRSEINVLTESISTLVTDGNGGSLMEQTEDGWTFNIGAIQSQLNNAVNSITDIQGDLSEKETVINAINGLADDIAEKTAYINMTTDDGGSPCIELGESTSDFKLRITNTSIDFMQGTSKIAYITNKSLYIQSSVVTDDFKIGSGAGFIWKRRSNGNMGLRWEAN